MKRKIKGGIILILLGVMFLFMFNKHQNSFDSNITTHNNRTINIVMINSYHQEHYWEGYVLEGLKKELNKHKDYNINLKVEYLDFRSKNSEEYNKSFEKLLEYKYAGSNIDVIYAVNDEAYELTKEMQNDKNSIFHKVPIVTTGIDQYLSKENKNLEKEIKGFYHVDDNINLLRLIMDLNEDVKKLNFIMENSLHSKYVKEEILSYMPTIKELAQRDIEVNFIVEDYIEDASKRLNNIKDNSKSVNILSGEFQYKGSKAFLNPKDTVKIIKLANSNPIYSNDQTYLEAGILGGCVDIGQQHGESAAKLIMEVIDDDGATSYALREEPLADIYVDYNGIYEYGIKIKNIDSSMKIINKKFYQVLVPEGTKALLIYNSILILLFVIWYLSREIKNIEKSKKRKEEEKMRLLRENLKSDFIVNLSHELRTPINLILNSSRTIKRKINNKSLMENDFEVIKENIEDKLDFINSNSYRLLKISNNIIDITKAESGLLKLELRNENIVNVVEDIFDNSIEFAKNKNIEMIFDSTEEEIIMAIDKMQIQRVVLNLISNAIKFTRNDGNIEVNVSKIKKEVLIEVKDTGIGIPKEYLQKIFDNFYQVDYSLTRMNEGTGIGLSIVRGIVNMHGGRVEVESKENEGSNFKIYIPITEIEEQKGDERVISITYDVKTMTNIELSDII